MKLTTLLTALLLFALVAFSFNEVNAQSIITGSVNQEKPNHIIWTVVSGDFDSLAAVWSKAFYLETENTTTTFDAQGVINLGTAAAGGGYSTVLLMYGSFDGSNWELVDSLGTVTSSSNVKLSIDLDDFDQCPFYKIKATNGKANNSFVLGLFRE